jgi:hypothetical protein
MEKHGFVRVTFKERLTDVATSSATEWKPWVDAPPGSLLERDTDPDGLMFMHSFPDVAVDPGREPFKDIPEGEKDGWNGTRVRKDVMDTARRRRGFTPDQIA